MQIQNFDTTKEIYGSNTKKPTSFEYLKTYSQKGTGSTL